jgi:hypothetical protein
MLDWLKKRPELPLPIYSNGPECDDGRGASTFRVFAETTSDLDRLAATFDRIDKPGYPNEQRPLILGGNPIRVLRRFGDNDVAFELCFAEVPELAHADSPELRPDDWRGCARCSSG